MTKREGAHQVFDHRKPGYQEEEILQTTGNRGVDIILEMLANVNLAHDTKLLAKEGRLIVIGSRGEVTINPRELMGRRASIRAFTRWGITPEEEADIHAGLFAGLENGTLRPTVGKELPLAEAARAPPKGATTAQTLLRRTNAGICVKQTNSPSSSKSQGRLQHQQPWPLLRCQGERPTS